MLSRLKQVCIQQESTEGSAVADGTLYAAGNAAYTISSLESNFDLQVAERDILRDTLTPLRGLTGRKFGSIKFSLELAGHTSTSAPEVDVPLKACGFRRQALRRYTIGAITGGPFKHGEVMSHTAGAVTATVVGDTYDGQTYMFVTQENGLGTGTLLAAPTTLTGATSGATVSGTAISSGTGGYGWWPTSFSITQLDFGNALDNSAAVGDVIKGATSGAIGIVAVAATTSDTTLYVRRLIGHFSGTEAVSNITAANTLNSSTTIAETQLHIPSLSIGALYDGVREAISGARGTVSLDCKIGEPIKLNFDFRGAKKSFSDGGLISGVSYTQALPAVWLDADNQVALDATTTYGTETTLNVSQNTIDMANDVQFRLSADDPTGQLETVITGRRPTFNMDPEYHPETHFGWLAAFAGNSNFRMRTRLGSPATPGTFLSTEKWFALSMPGCAITSMTPGDRDGIQTRNISGSLTSGSPSSTSAVQKNNELVIIYNNGAT